LALIKYVNYKTFSMKRLLLFVPILIFFSCHNSDSSTIEADFLNKERELEYLNAQDLRETVELRKRLRNSKSHSSIFSEIEEIGPNKAEGLCRNSGGCLSGMVKSMVIDLEDENTFVIATQTGGAWVSYDKGESWKPIDDDWAGVVMNWVVQDKSNPDRFYFCCKGPGLLVWDKSTSDGLMEWVGTINGIEESTFNRSYYIKFDPDNDEVHYLAGNNSIYKWENEEYTELPHTVSRFQEDGDFEIVPQVGIVIASSDSLHTFRDDGSYYGFATGIRAGQGSEIAFSPSDPNILYSFSFFPSGNIFHLFRSLNGGIDWEQLGSPFTSYVGQLHDQTLEIHEYDETHELIIIGTIRMVMAIVDKEHINPPAFKNLHVVQFDYHGTLKDEDEIYFYNDGGLFRVDVEELNTTDQSISIREEATSLFNGLNTLQAVELAVHDSLDRLAFGLWHNGSWFKDQNGDYSVTSGGDGFESAFHPEDDNLLYSSQQNHYIFRYDISNKIVFRISRNLENGPFRTKMFTHFSRPDDLFYLDGGIGMIPNASSCLDDNCLAIQLCEIQNIQSVSYDKSRRDSSVFFNTYNELYEITALGSSDCKLIYSAPSSSFRYIYLNENEDVGTIHILMNNNDVLKIIRLPSGEYELVETISLDFPTNVSLREFLVVGDSVKHIVIGTTAGLYVARYGDEQMMPVPLLPNIRVEDLDYDKKGNKIYITTYGRGIWSATLKDEFPTSTSDIIKEVTLELYPNPSVDHINITSLISEELIMINSNGQIVSKFFAYENGEVRKSTEHLSSGLYWIRGTKSKSIQKFYKL